MTKYVTKSGDMFDYIAYRELGDELLAGEVMRLNPKYIDVIVFGAGVELALPDDEEIEEKPDRELPPWKRDE